MCVSHTETPRSSVCCIIPPHMLDVLSMRGDKKTREMAASLIKQSNATRDGRSSKPNETLQKYEAGTPAGSFADGETLVSNFATAALISGSGSGGRLNRVVYNGNKKAALPGNLVRREGDPATGDAAVDEVYDGAGAFYRHFFEEHLRDSFDGKGGVIEQTVHHRRNYNNAFWDGNRMVYGDGDGNIFSKFSELSVVAHEISHAVVQHSGGLAYQDQSGALNESFADVFGALTLQREQRQSAGEASWLIGQGTLGPKINGVALRSMKAPGTAYSDPVLGQDPQPYHLDFYNLTKEDNGGVHINSGIPNHAFYLFSQYLGGNAWDKPGKVWYRSLQRNNNPFITFFGWAVLTVEVSMELFGIGSWEAHMLRRAWKLVGLSV